VKWLRRHWNLFNHDVTPPEARQWLDDLMTLARAAESLAASQR